MDWQKPVIVVVMVVVIGAVLFLIFAEESGQDIFTTENETQEEVIESEGQSYSEWEEGIKDEAYGYYVSVMNCINNCSSRDECISQGCYSNCNRDLVTNILDLTKRANNEGQKYDLTELEINDIIFEETEYNDAAPRRYLDCIEQCFGPDCIESDCTKSCGSILR